MNKGTLHLIVFVLVIWFVYMHFIRKVPFKN